MRIKFKIQLLICVFSILSLKASLVEEEVLNIGAIEVNLLPGAQNQVTITEITNEQQLVNAIKLNNLDAVMQLLSQNPDLDVNFTVDNDDTRPIHLAIDKNLAILEALLVRKADPNAVTKSDGYTPLHLIATRTDLDKDQRRNVAKLLLKLGVNPKLRCKAANGHNDIVAAQLARNCKNWPVENTISGNTKRKRKKATSDSTFKSLAEAIKAKNVVYITEILERNEDIDLNEFKGDLLGLALQNGLDSGTTKLIMEKTNTPKVVSDETKRRNSGTRSKKPRRADYEQMEHALTTTVSESSVSSAQKKLIDAISSNNAVAVLQVFQDNQDLNPNFIAESDNKRPIHLAIEKDPKITKILLEHNANPNAQIYSNGYTVLHLLASNLNISDNQKQIAEMLVASSKVDLEIKSKCFPGQHKEIIAKTLARNIKNSFMINLLAKKMRNNKRKHEILSEQYYKDLAGAIKNNDLALVTNLLEQNNNIDINPAKFMLLNSALENNAKPEITQLILSKTTN